MDLARILLSIALAALLLFTGGGKVLSIARFSTNRDGLGVAPGVWKGIGALELLAVVGLIGGIWFPLVGLAASVGVALLMLGAIVTRVRAGGRHGSGIPMDVATLVLAVAIAVLSYRQL